MVRVNKNNRGQSAFTIVELLIIVVVIGILASLVMLSYRLMTQKAIAASLQSDLANSARLLELDKVTNNTYPSTEPEANNGKGLAKSPGTVLTYTPVSGGYCLSATSSANSSITFHISSSSGGIINQGACGSDDGVDDGDGGGGDDGGGDDGGDGGDGGGGSGWTWKQVAAGWKFSCAIAQDDKAYCWGFGYEGELGNGALNNSGTPVQVAQGAMPSGAIKQISSGGTHTCAIASDDWVYCWGEGTDGQLGQGANVNSNVPVRVSQGEMPSGVIKQVVSGEFHTCAIASNDRVYCWGYNGDGELGNNTTTEVNTPVVTSVGGTTTGTFKQIDSQTYSNCGISLDDNRAYCWGANWNGGIGNNTTDEAHVPVQVWLGAMPSGGVVKKVIVGDSHSCAIASDDKAYCWGYNGDGELGDGTFNDSLIPVQVAQGAMPVGSITVKQIDAGDYHTCAIASDDKAYCWGDNSDGEIGDNTLIDRGTPVQVLQGAMPVTNTVKQLAGGYSHTCALGINNKTYCWGDNGSGELGLGHFDDVHVPVQIMSGALPSGAIKQIAAGQSHTCVIASDDKVYCWGLNGSGQLGDGTTSYRSIPVQVLQGAMSSGAVKKIAAGASHTCAIASDDRTYCWGSNSDGQLGDNTTNSVSTPIQASVGSMPSGNVSQITANGNNTCAINASDNKSYCWGDNWRGQLGNNTTTDSHVPYQVSQGAMPSQIVKKITSGYTHTCAIASNDSVYCWGENSDGQLGDNTTTYRKLPVLTLQGAMPSGAITQVSGGRYHTCAVASDSRTYCWGDNYSGQLGNNTTTDSHVPVQVSQGAMSSATVTQISAIYNHSCVVGSDNNAYCWGSNSNGALGNDSMTNSSLPVLVSAGAMPSSAVKQIIGGYWHTCAIASNDNVYCWGYNGVGVLGTTYHSSLGDMLPSLTVEPN